MVNNSFKIAFMEKEQSTHSRVDATDLRILERLQTDASVSNLELAAAVHVSPATCLRPALPKSSLSGSMFSFKTVLPFRETRTPGS